jgi:hypothetical protein
MPRLLPDPTRGAITTQLEDDALISDLRYVFPQNGQQMPNGMPAHEQMPPDVAQALELLRNYSFKDVYRWLKIDRQDGTEGSLASNHASSGSTNHGVIYRTQSEFCDHESSTVVATPSTPRSAHVRGIFNPWVVSRILSLLGGRQTDINRIYEHHVQSSVRSGAADESESQLGGHSPSI